MKIWHQTNICILLATLLLGVANLIGCEAKMTPAEERAHAQRVLDQAVAGAQSSPSVLALQARARGYAERASHLRSEASILDSRARSQSQSFMGRAMNQGVGASMQAHQERLRASDVEKLAAGARKAAEIEMKRVAWASLSVNEQKLVRKHIPEFTQSVQGR